MRVSATFKWIGLALLGIAVAAVVAIAAGNLASRQIGLASEPITAGEALAPAAGPNRGHAPSHSARGHSDSQPTPTTPTTTEPQPEEPPPTTTVETPAPEDGDDHGSHGADD